MARLYSERLGYTVNESTVRGIKKRYLEVTPMFHLSASEETMMLLFPQFFFSFSYFPFPYFLLFIYPCFHISSFSYFPRQGVHKGKISSPGVSPRASGGEDNSREGGEEEEEEEEASVLFCISFF